MFSTDTSSKEGEIPRDKWGRYILPDPSTFKNQSWTRATTFCKTLSDTFALSAWGERMVVLGLSRRDDLYALAASTSPDDKEKLNSIANEAKETAGSKVATSMGTAIHSFTEQIDRGEDPDIPEKWRGDLDSYRRMIDHYGFEMNPSLIERVVVVPEYGVAGTFDRIVRVTKKVSLEIPSKGTVVLNPGDHVVGDVKTNKNLSYAVNEISIQLALYSRAEAMYNYGAGEYEKLPEIRKDVGLVFHVPVGKSDAKLHALDIETGWKTAKLCDSVRAWRKMRGLSGTEAEVVPSSTWEDQIRMANSSHDLSEIWRQATLKGEWTKELEDLGKKRLTEL